MRKTKIQLTPDVKSKDHREALQALFDCLLTAEHEQTDASKRDSWIELIEVDLCGVGLLSAPSAAQYRRRWTQAMCSRRDFASALKERIDILAKALVDPNAFKETSNE